MERNLSKRFESLERQKAKLIQNFEDTWCLEQLHFKPSRNQWSLLEVFDHIVKVDISVTKYLCGYQESISEEKLGFGTHLRWLLLKSFLCSPFKVRAPRITGIQPAAIDGVGSIIASWVKYRLLLKDYLEIFPRDKLTHFVFKHPFSGSLNMNQTLKFIYYHTRHHKYQMNRIETHPQFPQR